ncbi:malate dehydrogenase-like [Culex pipiens pallens]|uniref:malate dehydrogenase-like n=1 Tax=Culex pipiens pallens TaxID=42434 RepID=UPI0022AB4667|nr:malate dehydrogenase-like [Culex pipiens pallens]
MVTIAFRSFGPERDKIAALTARIQEVLKAKAGAGSATFTTAYAAARFALAEPWSAQGERLRARAAKEGHSGAETNIRKGKEFVKKNFVNKKSEFRSC